MASFPDEEEEFSQELMNEKDNDLSDEDTEEEEESSDSEESSDEDERSENIANESNILYGKDNSIWFNQPQKVKQRLPLFKQTNSEVVNPLVPTHSIKSTFEWFLTDEIIEKIVDATNQRGKFDHGEAWKDTDDVEILAWLGLHLRAGVNKDNHRPVSELFASKTGPPIYGATMPRDRFTLLKESIRFDDLNTRTERKSKEKQGKLAPIEEIFNLFIENCKLNYSPGDNITVDETIVAFNGKCSFKVYMPSKPDKHGIKIWSCCDSKSSYLLNAKIYKGKELDKKETGQAERVVKDLVYMLRDTGTNVTMDNFFTSIKLSKDLLDNGLSILGTMRKNKKEIPPSFQASRNRVAHSTEFAFSKESRLMLCSYVPRKNKSVIMISSKHYEKEIEEGPRHKPEIIAEYNRTKSGVDTLDQLVKTYSCKRVTNRWPLAIFYYMVDVAAYNSSVCFMNKNPHLYIGSQKRRKYLMDLSESLVMPLIQRRASSANFQRLHKDTKSKIEAFVPISTIIEPIQSNNPRKRCSKCPREKGKKTKRISSRCSAPVCESHSKYICTDCD